MTTYFMDTSALGKRYIAEIGSFWIMREMTPISGHTVVISELTTVEFRSILTRRLRSRQLTPSDISRLRADFLFHLDEEYLVTPLDTPVLIQANELIDKYPLRTLDAIQLASAIKSKSELDETLVFVSADNDLLAAAAGEGFRIDNPLLHPSP